MTPTLTVRGALVLAAWSVLGAIGTGQDFRVVDAAKDADWFTLQGLVDERADVAVRRADGTTALHWASYWGSLDSADLLIRAGADVNAVSDLGVTPLWAACENGSAEIVETLLAAGANPNVGLVSGETPLMTAARAGSTDVVRQLLARGAEPNAREQSHDQTALMWAVAQQHPAVVALLLEYGAEVHARAKSWTEHLKLTKQAVNPAYNVVVPQGGYTPLLFAARVGDLASAKLLVAAGADVDDTAAYGTSATVVAAHSGHGELAAWLVEQGAAPDAAGAGYTALHAAILHRDEALAQVLLEHGASPHLRVERSTPARRESIDYHLDPAMVGATPFWLAARFAAPGIMRLLAEHGADTMVVHDVAHYRGFRPDLVVEGPTTALMAAADMGGRLYRVAGDSRFPFVETEAEILETVKAAVEFDIDVNAANADGDTALHALAAKGYDAAVAFLVEHGARLDARNKNGVTPLRAAARHPSTVKLLRGLGANE